MQKYLNIKELSEILGYSCRAIYEWTHIGFIPHYKFSKGVRFKRTEIENWLSARKCKGRKKFKLSV